MQSFSVISQYDSGGMTVSTNGMTYLLIYLRRRGLFLRSLMIALSFVALLR